jgi:hypothetical protein
MSAQGFGNPRTREGDGAAPWTLVVPGMSSPTASAITTVVAVATSAPWSCSGAHQPSGSSSPSHIWLVRRHHRDAICLLDAPAGVQRSRRAARKHPSTARAARPACRSDRIAASEFVRPDVDRHLMSPPSRPSAHVVENRLVAYARSAAADVITHHRQPHRNRRRPVAGVAVHRAMVSRGADG